MKKYNEINVYCVLNCLVFLRKIRKLQESLESSKQTRTTGKTATHESYDLTLSTKNVVPFIKLIVTFISSLGAFRSFSVALSHVHAHTQICSEKESEPP